MTLKLHLIALMSFLGTSFLLAQANQPIEIATQYLQRNLDRLQLTEGDLQGMTVSDQYVSKHNEVTHLYLQQRHQGIAVHNALININVLPNGEILGTGNRFVGQLSKRVNAVTPSISMNRAIASVQGHFQLEAAAPLQMLKVIDDKTAIFEPTGLALEPIEVKLVYQPMPDKSVRLAWNVVYYELSGQHWWVARVDALNGKVLDYFDQIVHCEFEEQDCETGEHNHVAETQAFTFLSPEGDPVYNVFAMPVESPNHGNRSLVVNPADSVASPWGWHDIDGDDEPEYTITRGNNVHAYQDIFSLNTSTGDEPDGGDSLCFDFPLDLSTNRPYTQLSPLVTNLFYWNNIMHDVWYQYGFDEASGNFQVNNFANGGVGEDHVRAEALDGSGTNNANFGTPPDGQNPRMQMYLWGGDLPNLPEPELAVTAPESLVGTYDFAGAAFGGQLPSADAPIISEVVLVEDGMGVTSDACEPIFNGSEIEGKVAMIDRGDCQFGFKGLAAEEEGAIAVIICNNAEQPNFNMAPGEVGDQVTIPVIMVSLQDCNELKMGLPGLSIQLSRPAYEVPQPGPTGRSSDFDNGVIVHEYTHGISTRLTGGPANSGCLTNMEQGGEGWSDWFSLVMTTTSEMTAEQVRGIGTYASGQPITGDGIRQYPYSRDMTVDPHTYADINSVAVPHGVGSVWCVMIWDLYWNLVDEYGFDEDIYRGTGGNNMAMQLVIDGLKLQPCNPSFVDARDAILAADVANYDGVNQCLIWETFARRGLGFSASAGGNESFDLPNACNMTFRVEKTAVTEADAGDVITYNLEITNGRAESIADATVTDLLPVGTTFLGSSDCDITEDNGVLTVNLGDVESGTVINCSYQVQLAASPFTYTTFEDDVEAGPQNWAFENPVGASSWIVSNSDANSGNFAFFADNIDSQSDQYLVLQVPQLLNGPNPTLSFWHRYNTEADWDGGVVEISTDGTTWDDLGGQMTQNGYDGIINTNPDSPISDRLAFNGNSGGWIQTIIDLSPFADQEVLVRFRLGCDGAVGGEGWYVDDIQFFGDFYSVTNTACVFNDDEPICSSITTIVYGQNPNATNDLNPELGLELFPNPTSGKFTVSLRRATYGEVMLEVMSIDGRSVLQQPFDASQNQVVDLSGYAAGIYIVQVSTEQGIAVQRVVVE